MLENSITAVSTSLIGNIAISVVAATVAGVSAYIFGLPFPLVLAVITGLLDLIPQVGATIAAVILTLVALTVSTEAAIAMVIIQLIYQQLENYVVYPIVYRQAVNLTGFTTIVSVLIAGSLLGVVGAILAVPFAAVIKTVVEEAGRPRRARMAELRAVEKPERGADLMCRWMAYRGQPLPIELLLYKTDHGLIEQSRHAKLGVETFNGDGFGLGWYTGAAEEPGVFRSLLPAWNDRNLRSLAAHIHSPLYLAHVRATTGTPVQETNCHPFRHENWLFVHNGAIDHYLDFRHDLIVAIDPAFFNVMEGSTDSEVMFCLALTFGLQDDPIPALERMAGFVEATGRQARHRASAADDARHQRR